jgi:hypothetical protein
VIVGEYGRELELPFGENEETCRRIANSSVELVSLTICVRSCGEGVPPYCFKAFDNCTTAWREKEVVD